MLIGLLGLLLGEWSAGCCVVMFVLGNLNDEVLIGLRGHWYVGGDGKIFFFDVDGDDCPVECNWLDELSVRVFSLQES